MKVVAALGGNALLRRGEALRADVQRRNVRLAAQALAAIARDHAVVITHGNGPQVGLLALQAAAAGGDWPLDILGAESEGMIGYVLQQEVANALPERDVVALLTQTLVAADDPAFDAPDKFVGPGCDEGEAAQMANELGWAFARDGDRLRRVVPSPAPRALLEIESIRLLVDAGIIVICAGGGGVPVIRRDGRLEGVEAVVDKDRASALLASELYADLLLLLTDVEAVYLDWGTDRARSLGRVTPDELDPEQFPAGSMRPKIEAACSFVRSTGGRAAIGAMDQARALLEGRAGTQITPGRDTPADRHGRR